VVAKELIDNALDAAEEAEIAPEIAVTVEPDTIIVEDNAGGIDADTITSVLDYTVRVSSREAYVSPTRGAQGNALKTILAMGFVLSKYVEGAATAGVTIIESRGVRHRIEFQVDHINNQPKIARRTSASPVTIGTRITVKWPHTRVPLFGHTAVRFRELVGAYAWLNPHLSLRGTWLGHTFIDVKATDPAWAKWRPRNPTSPHWYDVPRLQRYLAAHVSRDRDLGQRRTVREFIAEFRGLSGTAVQRKILDEVGCSHQSLASFFGARRVNSDGVARLLAAMKKYSKPVAPKLLGIIGEDHLKLRFLEARGNAETFAYQRRMETTEDGIPYVVEFGFGLHQSGLAPGGGGSRVANNNGAITVVGGRLFVTGANWSAAIDNPFRSFGSTGVGLENTLSKVRADGNQPVICALHLASARLQFADRGKSSIILTDDARQPDD
jgi:DNA topoisomerase VI subunit B